MVHTLFLSRPKGALATFDNAPKELIIIRAHLNHFFGSQIRHVLSQSGLYKMIAMTFSCLVFSEYDSDMASTSLCRDSSFVFRPNLDVHVK